MRGSGLVAAAILLVTVASAPAGRASAETGIVAITGAALHGGALDPLLPFGDGRTVSLLPHFRALAQHAAEDAAVVLLSLETGAVGTAEASLGDTIFYDDLAIGRTVSKLLQEPGSALLLENPTGVLDATSATQARATFPSGETLTLHRDPGVAALPEPGTAAGVAAGAVLLFALGRRTRPAAR